MYHRQQVVAGFLHAGVFCFREAIAVDTDIEMRQRPVAAHRRIRVAAFDAEIGGADRRAREREIGALLGVDAGHDLGALCRRQVRQHERRRLGK